MLAGWSVRDSLAKSCRWKFRTGPEASETREQNEAKNRVGNLGRYRYLLEV